MGSQGEACIPRCWSPGAAGWAWGCIWLPLGTDPLGFSFALGSVHPSTLTSAYTLWWERSQKVR